MSTSFAISGPYPGLQYIPASPEPSGVYHEDREINGALWRVYNATFDGSQWSYSGGALAGNAFAFIQNVDGSTSFKTYSGPTPWEPDDWVGSGNHTVFNAADYGMIPGGDPVVNTAALQAAIRGAAAAGGGRVFIPAAVYPVLGTITVPATQDGTTSTPAVGIVIEGSSGSTQLAQQATTTTNTFSLTGDNDEKGVVFRNLRISYATPQMCPGSWAVYSTLQDVICEDCYFEDCPGAMYMGGLRNGLASCTIFFDVDDHPNTEGQTMVYMAGPDDFVDLCYIYQKTVHGGGPIECVGIQVASASEPRVTDTNIVDFDYGIQVTGSSTNLIHGLFSNLACECNVTAVLIQPGGPDANIYELFFVNCIFERTRYSVSATPGIYVDVYRAGGAAGDPDTVSDIGFANCMSHDWAGPAMQIGSGQDIIVTGGRYGQSATDDSMATSGAIAVTGTALRVTVVGADCSAQIPAYMSQPSPMNPQPYSLSVTGVVTQMQVRSCNLSGNAHGALYVSPHGADLRVSDCDDYNDQNTPVAALPPTLIPQNAASLGYYGPSLITFSNPTTIVVTLSSVTYSMGFCCIPLQPTDEVQFSATPTKFTWLGK